MHIDINIDLLISIFKNLVIKADTEKNIKKLEKNCKYSIDFNT